MADVSDKIAHLEQLAATLRRRLRVREAQRARFDERDAPAHLVLELEDVRRELARHEADLRRLRPGPPDDRPPYLGLATFQEANADRFFGRDALIADLIERAGRAPFLAVLGASGSGKSSVVRAGLIPMLKGGALPGSDHWRYVVLRPGARPLDTLAAELAKLQGSDLDQALRLRATLADNGNALLLAADLLIDNSTNQHLVLVVDQFEELWTLTQSEQRAQFINVLLTAANAPDTPLLVVLAMRADFLHRAAEHPALARAIADHDVIVSPMTLAELRDAIVRPAELAGDSFEPGLVDDLIEQTHGRVGALPLLAYTLQELWKQRDNGKLNWAAYRALGGIEGALAGRADAILAQHYTPEQQENLRRLLLRLVQPGEGAADTRRRVHLDDLVPAGASLNDIQLLIKPLVDERLLTTGRDVVTGIETIEISHEALIHAWPTFSRWIAQARTDLRFQLQLEEAAREWEAIGKDADFLWGGLRLANADAWIARAQPRLNVRAQAFLDASHEAMLEMQKREEEDKRAVEQALDRAEEQLRISESNRLAFAALSQIKEAGETALLLACEAVLHDHNATTEQALRDALDNVPWAVVPLRGHQAEVNSAVFSPDGQYILTASSDNTARLWRTDGQSLARLEHSSFVFMAMFNSDGQYILTTSSDTPTGLKVRLWDSSGKPLGTLPGSWADALFSPDGQSILTVAGGVQLWNLSGQPLLPEWNIREQGVWGEGYIPAYKVRREGHTDPVKHAFFSPDGQQILTTSRDSNRLWDRSGQPLATLRQDQGIVISASFSTDGQRILTASTDMMARLWNAQGELLATLTGHSHDVISAIFSPDGRYILTGSSDCTARLWDLSGQSLAVLRGHTYPVNTALFSPDGQHILTASGDGTARLWNLGGQQLAVLQGHTAACGATFSPDLGRQRILTSSNDHTARLWDWVGPPLPALRDRSEWMTSTISIDDDQYALIVAEDGKVRLKQNNHKVATLQGYTGGNRRGVLSPDRQRILTVSASAVQLWNVSGQPLATLQRVEKVLDRPSLRFSYDSRRALIITKGIARLYLVRTEDLLAVAACRVGRGLTNWEIQRFQVPLPLKFDFSKRQCPPVLDNL